MTQTLPPPVSSGTTAPRTVPTVSTVKMTVRQFVQMGEDPPGVRLELVDGAIAVSPSPVPRHSYVITKLISLLDPYITENDLGELYADVDTILDEYNIRRPDLLFFRKDRLDQVGEKAMLGPPDLAVEVVSESSSKIDRVDKFEQYAAAGVAFYWIVDPASRSLEGWRLEQGASYVKAGDARNEGSIALPPFESLAVPLDKLWRK